MLWKIKAFFITGCFWFGNSVATSHCSTFFMWKWHRIIEVRDHVCNTGDKGLTQHPHARWVYSELHWMPIVCYKISQNNTKGLFALKMWEMCKHEVSLYVCLCCSLGSALVSQASCPSGIHNKASCSVWWGSGRGSSTMATIWALWGPALWSGAAELGKLEQWGISGHQRELWVPAAAARAQKGLFFTHNNVVSLTFVHQ